MNYLAALLLTLTLGVAHAADDMPEWLPLEVVATGPCCGPCCCGPRAANLTADGTDTLTTPYGVAVDPRVIAYGTYVYVPLGCGYLDQQITNEDSRVFIADDTGGIIRRRTRQTGVPHIDLRFRTHRAALKYGKRTITIYIWR